MKLPQVHLQGSEESALNRVLAHLADLTGSAVRVGYADVVRYCLIFTDNCLQQGLSPQREEANASQQHIPNGEDNG